MAPTRFRRALKRSTKRTKKTTITKAVRSAITKMAEKKILSYGPFRTSDPTTVPATLTDMTHNSWNWVSMVNGIVQGTTIRDRLGKSIFVRYIEIAFHMDAFVKDYEGLNVRLMVVKNKKCNGSFIATADMFEARSTAGNVMSVGYDSLYNENFGDKYKVLLDKQMNFTTTAVTSVSTGALGAHATHNNIGIKRFYIPVNEKIDYSTQPGSVVWTSSANLTHTDLIFGVCCGNGVTVGSPLSTCRDRVSFRVAFNDM